MERVRMEKYRFRELFLRKAIIGMIHLAGKNREDGVNELSEVLNELNEKKQIV